MQVNKRENMNPVVQKIDSLVMDESDKLLKALEDACDLYAGLIEIQRDRMIQSTDASFPISLAKLGELQLQALKQKNDVLKNLTSYKQAETAGQRKGTGELSISDLLNSAALGAGMGAKINMSGQAVQPKLINEDGEQDMITVQIENMTTNMPSPESAAETLMRDFK
ncbi:MAG: hypothetical protein JHC33_09345 [Ignisphaera sp.]|nr:hypothetical protein [Ignisphaera sp.]